MDILKKPDRWFERLTARLKGWRTMLINALFAIEPILALTEIRDIIPDKYTSAYALVVVLVNMYLRKQTTSPVGKKL